MQRKAMLWMFSATSHKWTNPKIMACKILPFLCPNNFINFLAINPLNRISSERAVLKIAMINKVSTESTLKPIALIFPATVIGD